MYDKSKYNNEGRDLNKKSLVRCSICDGNHYRAGCPYPKAPVNEAAENSPRGHFERNVRSRSPTPVRVHFKDSDRSEHTKSGSKSHTIVVGSDKQVTITKVGKATAIIVPETIPRRLICLLYTSDAADE